MKIVPVKQNTPGWLQARLGLPTASEFYRIVTPTGKLSTQSAAYAHRLLAEWITGAPLEDGYESQWMERGHDLEDEAISAFEFETGHTVERVGFCMTDDGRYGCSPDGLIGDWGGAEMKSVSPQVQVGYLLGRGVDEKYKPQVQGNLLVTGRRLWYTVAYCPGLPTSVKSIAPDETYLAALSAALDQFCDELEAAKEMLRTRYGVVPKPKVRTEPDGRYGFDVTDEDVSRIYAAAKGRQ